MTDRNDKAWETMATLPGAATLALSRCDLLERRVAELEGRLASATESIFDIHRRTQLLLEQSVNRCAGGTFVCLVCWSWSAAHQSCECGKNQRYIDDPGMHRSGANGSSAGDPPLQCPDATRGAPLTAEQGTSATIASEGAPRAPSKGTPPSGVTAGETAFTSGTPSTAPACAPPTSSTAEATGAGVHFSDASPLQFVPWSKAGEFYSPSVGHGAQGEPATGQSSIWSPHETADGGLFHPYDDIPVPHGDVQPGDRCVVYTGGVPCIKPGTVVERVGERWRVQIDRASTCVVGEEEMVLVPQEWAE